LTQNGTAVDLHEPSATGSCIAIESGWMNKVHGYDEYYTYWGREDTDLLNRAIEDGYEVIWITDKTKMWHQWHEPATQRTLEQNDWYFNQKKPIIRNPNGWGEI
jgi:GT2 family glycosyltransferase